MAETKDKGKSFWDEFMNLLKDLFAAFLIFILVIFVFGELYAIYFMNSGNAFMLWFPVLLLMAALFYKVLK